ncbi:hypothetical protein BB559_006682 [Furculomyces boomerangus]|uniref:Uncharacterized protein n=1 Tax=Furculomyces boomerangus TaxID=61424 RepID=A0A2T9Y177_9FUNG|nr:hypothetical protein BB559_006682 [Furculomyces boomerangus]
MLLPTLSIRSIEIKILPAQYSPERVQERKTLDGNIEWYKNKMLDDFKSKLTVNSKTNFEIVENNSNPSNSIREKVETTENFIGKAKEKIDGFQEKFINNDTPFKEPVFEHKVDSSLAGDINDIKAKDTNFKDKQNHQNTKDDYEKNINSDSSFDEEWWEVDDSDENENSKVPKYSDDYMKETDNVKSKRNNKKPVNVFDELSFFGKTWLLLDNLCTTKTSDFLVSLSDTNYSLTEIVNKFQDDLKETRKQGSNNMEVGDITQNNGKQDEIEGLMDVDRHDDNIIQLKQRKIFSDAVKKEIIYMKRFVFIYPDLEELMGIAIFTFSVNNKSAIVNIKSMRFILISLIYALLKSRNSLGEVDTSKNSTNNGNVDNNKQNSDYDQMNVSENTYMYENRNEYEIGMTRYVKNAKSLMFLLEKFGLDYSEVVFLSKRFTSTF